MPHERRAWLWREQDLQRVQHMLDAAFALGCTRESLRRGDVPTLGLVKELEIIGEAASQIDSGVLPNIEWAKIIGMRHRLVHGYSDINLDIVWATAMDVLPPFIEELEAFLQRLRPPLFDQ